ncbi:MAG: DUF4421 family protein [Cyclobacteriaceae bacterium]|nr:DUF4421 family protein [Cyclobacteriaceae bacterium]
MRITSLLFLLLFISISSYGQRNDSLRNIYVERFPDHFFIWPVLKQRSTSFEVEQKHNRSNNLIFKPNNSYGAGFGLYLFEIGAEVTFSVPIQEYKNELYGETKATDFQLNLLSKHWGADVFYQRYSGFYVSDPNRSIPRNTPFPQRPDMVTDNVGVNGIYMFNRNKFSLRSAYNFAERQKKSAGSFLLTGTFNSFHLKADSAIYGKDYEAEFGSDAAVSDFQSLTFSIAPGYTYTVVIKKFFINASFSVGPAVRTLDYIVKDERQVSTGVDGFTDYRGSIGYNGDRFFGGISFISQKRGVTFDEAKLTSVSSTFKFLIGYRFREFGILKARAVDIIPFVKKK